MLCAIIYCRLLKDKRVMDDSFNSFLELKRGAAMHTLESLMLLPVSWSESPQTSILAGLTCTYACGHSVIIIDSETSLFLSLSLSLSLSLKVQRIYEYHKFLMQLYKITPKEHCDYHDLRYTVACVGSVSLVVPHAGCVVNTRS